MSVVYTFVSCRVPHSSDCCRAWSWTWSCVWRATTGGLASPSWGVLTRASGLVLTTSSQVSAKCSTILFCLSTSLSARYYYNNLCTVESDRNLKVPREELLSVSPLRAVRVRYWRVVLIGWLGGSLVGDKQLQNCCRSVLPAVKGTMALFFIQYSYYIQGDQKVSVHLMITIQSSGERPVYSGTV